MNYKVAPVVRPNLSVDVLTSFGVLVVFGVEGMTWDLVAPVVPTEVPAAVEREMKK